MAINIKVGELRIPIEIQRFEHATDEWGFSTPKWTTFATPRAKINFDDRLIRQRASDDGIDVTLVRLFGIRYIPNITTKDRIYYKGKEFEIYSIENQEERNRFLMLWGREIESAS